MKNLFEETKTWLKGTNLVLLAHIIRSLLPREPLLNPIEYDNIEQEVVNFVAVQIASMPGFLRIPYQCALQGFNWLALLRYCRPYLKLNRDTQQKYLLAWSQSPIRFMRDFVKLIQSCALLYYLDHESMIARLESAK
jgi:hypothetical protein